MIGVAFLGRDALPLGLALGFGALGWKIYATIQERRRLASKLEATRRRWGALPGATTNERGIVHVHHDEQPLWIALSDRPDGLMAHIALPIRPSAVSLAIWPEDRPRPPLGAEGQPFGGPPMDPAPLLTAAIGSGLHVAAGDEDDAARLLDPDVIEPLRVVAEEAPKSFGGLTFDGQRLTIHITGPMAGDPERATWLAKRLWSPWV
jgi:hypothetical protein